MRARARTWRSAALAGVLLAASARAASAHEGPSDGAEWLMADWMLLSFLVFFGVALAAFLLTWKRGHFHDLEGPKYELLRIEEPDYYTPAWAKEEDGRAPER